MPILITLRPEARAANKLPEKDGGDFQKRMTVFKTVIGDPVAKAQIKKDVITLDKTLP